MNNLASFKTDCDVWKQQAQFYKHELEDHLNEKSFGNPYLIGGVGVLGIVLGFIVGREIK